MLEQVVMNRTCGQAVALACKVGIDAEVGMHTGCDRFPQGEGQVETAEPARLAET